MDYSQLIEKLKGLPVSDKYGILELLSVIQEDHLIPGADSGKPETCIDERQAREIVACLEQKGLLSTQKESKNSGTDYEQVEKHYSDKDSVEYEIRHIMTCLEIGATLPSFTRMLADRYFERDGYTRKFTS